MYAFQSLCGTILKLRVQQKVNDFIFYFLRKSFIIKLYILSLKENVIYQDSNGRFKYRIKFNFNWEIYIYIYIYICFGFTLGIGNFKSLYIKILWG